MFATAQDVAVELGLDALTIEQEYLANAKIEAVEAAIRLRYPNIDTRTANSVDLMTIVTNVVATAVARVLRNPDGKIQEAIDDYSFRRADTADGSLTLTAEEWATLAATPAPSSPTTAFTISPVGHTRHHHRYPLIDYYPPDIYGEVPW